MADYGIVPSDELKAFVRAEYAAHECYPPKDRILAALDLTPFSEVKVVILGQDPYHEPGEAQGLAFYVPENVKVPPSLLNIAKELEAERGPVTKTPHPVAVPDLKDWAVQGVLLLNATLTVRRGAAGSHFGHGWEAFTDAIVKKLAVEREHLVFILWGSHAQKKGAAIDPQRHLVLRSAHPSPLSAYRGFFGCNHFNLANEYLVKHGKAPIQWLRAVRSS